MLTDPARLPCSSTQLGLRKMSSRTEGGIIIFSFLAVLDQIIASGLPTLDMPCV